MATWKVALALAAGCAAILKPFELAFVTCLELAEVCREIGLPPSVLNILSELGHEAGAPLASHPNVDKANIVQDDEKNYNYCAYDSDIAIGYCVGAFLFLLVG